MVELREMPGHRFGYKMIPPEGGWGHLVTFALVLMNWVSLCPLAIFGLVYGGLLSRIGDEASATALANGVFNTVQCFTGLVSSFLLKKYTYRKVAFFGTLVYSLGAFGCYFVGSVGELIFYFGVLQGFGSGLLLPAFYTAFQAFFDEKLNLMMGISQALAILGTMILPIVATVSINKIGYQLTLLILAAMSLLNIPASALLRPVQKYLKRIPLGVNKTSDVPHIKLNAVSEDIHQIDPLIDKNYSVDASRNGDYIKTVEIEDGEVILPLKVRKSIISIDDRHVSVTNINQVGIKEAENTGFSDLLDISLFKSPVFVNITAGLSLSFSADMAFTPLIPLMLRYKGLDGQQIALMLSVYFAVDVLARISFSVASAFLTFRNRYVFLGGTLLTAVFRLVFVYSSGYTWVSVTICILGFLRCFIQTPLPLVVMEEYSDDFSTAFSLYMVVCGVVNLILGPLMSYVKTTTGNLDMVMHVMTGALLLCTVSWILEITLRRRRNHNSNQ